MKKKALFITKAAVIAALYAALTYLSGIFGLAYSGVQFRISEALTVLPIFTAAAVPGLTVGCVLANMLSTINPADMLIGSLATLLAAVLTRRLKNIQIKGYPLLSVLMPVLINAVFVGAELTFFSASEDSAAAFFAASALSVGTGEALVCFTLGTALIVFIKRSRRLSELLK